MTVTAIDDRRAIDDGNGNCTSNLSLELLQCIQHCGHCIARGISCTTMLTALTSLADGALLEWLECALLGLETQAKQTLNCLLAGCVLLLADDPTGLCLHQILAGQTAAGVLCIAMEYLCLGANCLNLLGCHFYITRRF